MAAKTRIIVLNADAKGVTTASSSAEVALVPKASIGSSVWPHAGLAATHALTGGHFEPSAPASDPTSGEWLLVVRQKDHSVAVQKLTFKESGGIVRASGGWSQFGPAFTAATISIVNYGEVKTGGAPSGPKESLITVTLHPVQHFVSMASPKDDATYQLFGKGRFSYLYDQARLNAGAAGILINAPKKETEIVVKAQSKDVAALVVVEKIPQPSPTGRLSMLDFYGALDRIGKDHPGSVVESAVWSHAWHQGPIIFNDSDNFPVVADRDPNDTDGRSKDWHATGVIAKSFPDLAKSYAKDGVFRIGGCSHMTNVVKEARAASANKKKGTARTQLYEVALPGGWMQTSLDYTKRSLAQYVQAPLHRPFDEQGSAAGFCTYLGRAAQVLPVTVFGAPPGCEGNMGTIKASTGKDLSTMKIVNTPYKDGSGAVVGGLENRDLTAYFADEFSSSYESDELNYMNYSKMAKAPLPNPGWDTRRAICMNLGDEDVFLRVASGLEFRRKRKEGTFERGVAHTEGAKSGHLFVAKKCLPERFVDIPYYDKVSWRYLELTGKTAAGTTTKDDFAIFVASDGEVRMRVRAAGASAFTPFSGTIAAIRADQNPAGGLVGVPLAPITSDLLEKALVQCHW